MRLLSEYEQALVAGGTTSSDYYTGGSGGPYGDGGGYGGGGGGGGFYYWVFNPGGSGYYDSTGAIVVTASSGYWAYMSFGDGYTGTGGVSTGGSGEAEPVANATPCVEAAPSGVPLSEINNAALAASNAIAALNDETYEYSSIIWQLNGTVGWTAPYTDRDTDFVKWLGGLSHVPDGAVIIGIVHNHPDLSGINDTIPSPSNLGGRDWSAYDAIRDWGGVRGITVDPNLLLYIYSNEDHKTHVYDRTDKETTRTSCSLQ